MSALLEVTRLTKHYPTPAGLLCAVDGVSFALDAGQTLGVVGESGCGKSTLGRAAIRLLDADGGNIFWRGRDITQSKDKTLRREMQIIFQDPFSSLNPRMSVFESIREPLWFHRIQAGRAATDARVEELMELVGLASALADSYPHQLDGGRRQRVGIARALALEPKLIVCDEPVSALDVSIQAQILNLLQDLQEERQLAYLFITHDLGVVKHISHHVMVMYLGAVVEHCAADALFRRPLHPYTKALLAAIPEPTLHKTRERILLPGEVSSPIGLGPGCRFASRCGHAADLCLREEPALAELEPGHLAACHRAEELAE